MYKEKFTCYSLIRSGIKRCRWLVIAGFRIVLGMIFHFLGEQLISREFVLCKVISNEYGIFTRKYYLVFEQIFMFRKAFTHKMFPWIVIFSKFFYCVVDIFVHNPNNIKNEWFFWERLLSNLSKDSAIILELIIQFNFTIWFDVEMLKKSFSKFTELKILIFLLLPIHKHKRNKSRQLFFLSSKINCAL